MTKQERIEKIARMIWTCSMATVSEGEIVAVAIDRTFFGECEHITVSEMICSKCGKRVPVKYDTPKRPVLPEELDEKEPLTKTSAAVSDENRVTLNQVIRHLKHKEEK